MWLNDRARARRTVVEHYIGALFLVLGSLYFVLVLCTLAFVLGHQVPVSHGVPRFQGSKYKAQSTKFKWSPAIPRLVL
jgi:hypothetical protein